MSKQQLAAEIRDAVLDADDAWCHLVTSSTTADSMGPAQSETTSCRCGNWRLCSGCTVRRCGRS